jgi:RHS repeat-associated protein
MALEYTLSDHLNSASITTDSAGTKVSEIRYKPWGETRYSWRDPNLNTSTPSYALTKYTFTGQYSYMDDPTTTATEGFGLMYYGARFYDPALGRFTSADSVIPGAGTSQAWDRFAYGLNNPSRYTDPSGHSATECGQDGSECSGTSDQEKADYEYWRQRNDALKCQAGNEDYCSYAENHPYEAAAYTVGGLVLSGAGAAAVAASSITTEAAVTTTATVETANAACGGDMCASETQDAVITILGRLQDTEAYVGVKVNILYEPYLPHLRTLEEFWEKVDKPFLNDAIARGDTIVYVSNLAKTPATALFFREAAYIAEIGYSNVVNLFAH